jgi:hypothetical protein
MLYLKYDLYVRKENGNWLLGIISFDNVNELQGFEDIDDLADTILGLVDYQSYDSIKQLLLVNSKELDK